MGTIPTKQENKIGEQVKDYHLEKKIPDNQSVNSLEQYKKTCNAHIEKIRLELELVENLKEKLNTCTLKEGDIIVTEKHGKGIICGFRLERKDDFHLGPTLPDTLKDSLCVVIATQKGFLTVKYDDVMPYNNSTKVLFDK